MTRIDNTTPGFMVAASLSRVFPAALLVVCFLAADVAGAAEKSKAAASAPASRTRLLTQAELRDCSAQETRVLALTNEAQKEKAAIEAEKNEILRIGSRLDEEVATLDKASAEAVDAYNAKVEAKDKLIDSYQAKVTAFNLKAESVNATRDAYASACDKRRYDERDLNDIKRKK